MFCVKCGYELPDEAYFCPKCGSKINLKSSMDNEDIEEHVNNKIQSIPAVDNNSVIHNMPDNYTGISEVREDIFSIKGLFSFRGRRNRAAYLGISILLSYWYVSSSKYFAYTLFKDDLAGIISSGIICLVTTYLIFVNAAKRSHDIDWPIWPAIIDAIALFVGSSNVIIIIASMCFHMYLICAPAQNDYNIYGTNPLLLRNNKNSVKRVIISIICFILFIISSVAMSIANNAGIR